MCILTGEIKNKLQYLETNKKKHDKIVLLAKPIPNTTEVLISKALIDSNISHEEFLSVNYGLKENDDMK